MTHTLCVAFLVNHLLFYAAGLFLAIRVARRWETPLLVTAVLWQLAIGYAMFWAYFLSPDLAKLLGCCVTAVAILGLGDKQVRRVLNSRPVLWAAVIGLFYTALLQLGAGPGSVLQSIQGRFLSQLFPQDNELPFAFAEKLFFGLDPKQLIYPYLSSDRPPLQTGMVLIWFPTLGRLFGHEIQYQSSSMVLQLLWVIVFSFHPWRLAALFLAFFGFFFVQSTFVWPKLFAGALGLWAFLEWQKQRDKTAAALFGFSLLAHTGVAFMAPLFLIRRAWKALVRFALIASAFYLPWMGYQKFYNPPGNYLAKDLLAGIQSTENQRTLTAIQQGYGTLSVAQITQQKWQNLLALWGPLKGSGWKTAEDWRYSEFFHGLRAFGLLGLLLLLVRSAWLHAIALSTLLWCLTLFGPATALVHHASYGIILAVFWILLEAMQRLPLPMQWSLMLVQTFQFFYLWGFR